MKRDAINNYKTIGDKYGIYYRGNTKENTKFNDMYVAPNDVEHMQEFFDMITNKPCFVYSDDVRWNTTDMDDTMDRVPYSFNA